MNLQEAYRKYNAEQAACLRFATNIRRIRKDLDALSETQDVLVARELIGTRAGKKILRAFNGHTLHGWEVACGTDGRWKRLARTIGWPRFTVIVELARTLESTPEAEWLPAWHLA